jgi:hypothetical protein
MLPSKLKDRRCYLLVTSFIPVSRAKLMPLLAGLHPDGNMFWRNNVQKGVHPLAIPTRKEKLLALRNLEIIRG